MVTVKSKEDTKSQWFDRHSQFNATNPRAVAEAELLGLPDTTVINLSGLWGGERSMRGYVSRVAPSKEALRNKVMHVFVLLNARANSLDRRACI